MTIEKYNKKYICTFKEIFFYSLEVHIDLKINCVYEIKMKFCLLN